jgi:hypothetical protein
MKFQTSISMLKYLNHILIWIQKDMLELTFLKNNHSQNICLIYRLKTINIEILKW